MTIEFTSQQLEFVCNILAQRPYNEVFQIIAMIQQQAAAQMQQQQPQLQAVQ